MLRVTSIAHVGCCTGLVDWISGLEEGLSDADSKKNAESKLHDCWKLIAALLKVNFAFLHDHFVSEHRSYGWCRCVSSVYFQLCQILLSACRKFTFSILHTLSIAQPLAWRQSITESDTHKIISNNTFRTFRNLKPSHKMFNNSYHRTPKPHVHNCPINNWVPKQKSKLKSTNG